MAGAVTSQLITELRNAIEDENNVKYSTDDRLYEYLSRTQLGIGSLLHNNYLIEFETVKSDIVVSEDGNNLADLSSKGGVLGGQKGIVTVYVHDSSAGITEYAHYLDKHNAFMNKNPYIQGSDSKILYKIVDGKIYVLMTTISKTGETKMDVTFLEIPNDIGSSVDPILNKAYHNILLSLAAEKHWLKEDKPGRAQNARQSAIERIQALNAVYQL